MNIFSNLHQKFHSVHIIIRIFIEISIVMREVQLMSYCSLVFWGKFFGLAPEPLRRYTWWCSRTRHVFSCTKADYAVLWDRHPTLIESRQCVSHLPFPCLHRGAVRQAILQYCDVRWSCPCQKSEPSRSILNLVNVLIELSRFLPWCLYCDLLWMVPMHRSKWYDCSVVLIVPEVSFNPLMLSYKSERLEGAGECMLLRTRK